ncbi:MAG: multiprotein bridging factor aMBF1 [Thermoplasmatota archaeon]
MPDCERCGRNTRLQLVEIAGARMYVCSDCSRFGKPVIEKKEAEPAPHRTAARPKTARPSKPDAMSKRERELADDYPRRIQRARESKGWSREELGRKLNEKVSIISKLENGEMHPSDQLIRKLEKVLEIRLMEEVEDIHLQSSGGSMGMTLGDFIVYKNK